MVEIYANEAHPHICSIYACAHMRVHTLILEVSWHSFKRDS